MPAIADLKEQYRSLATQAHNIVEDKSLTAAEVRERLDGVETDLKAIGAQIADEEYLSDRRKAFGPVAADEAPAPTAETAKSFGQQVVTSDRFKSFVEQVKAGGGDRHSGPIELKATITPAGLTGGTGVLDVDRQTGIRPVLQERLTVADLMPNGTANGSIIRYVVEVATSNAASTVAPNGVKPDANLDLTTREDALKKIAVVARTAEELLDDVEGFSSFLNGRVVQMVEHRLEQQLISGTGSGNDIQGILNRSGLTSAQAKGGDSIAVAAHKAITRARIASTLSPSGMVWHPADWEAAKLEADSNGQFFGGGPFTGPYGNGPAVAYETFWGIPCVVTTAMTENTVLIGNFSLGAQLFKRRGITVDLSNSDQDNFVRNLVSTRAEIRAALAVYVPASFVTVSGV